MLYGWLEIEFKRQKYLQYRALKTKQQSSFEFDRKHIGAKYEENFLEGITLQGGKAPITFSELFKHITAELGFYFM